MDKSVLERWRSLDAAAVLRACADYAKRDVTFMPRESIESTRWHARINTSEVELLCTGPKFFDTRAGYGGGGAVDLVMHLYGISFKAATQLLNSKGL